MGTLSVKDGILHADGKPCRWWEPIEGGWQYISDGPGASFRAIFTVEDGAQVIREQYQHRESVEAEWVNIDDPWGRSAE